MRSEEERGEEESEDEDAYISRAGASTWTRCSTRTKSDLKVVERIKERGEEEIRQAEAGGAAEAQADQ